MVLTRLVHLPAVPIENTCCLMFKNMSKLTKKGNSLFQTFTVFWMLYAFFWAVARHLNFICRRFGTLGLFRLHGRVGMKNHTYPPMKLEQTVCSETSAYKIQMPGNCPEESIQQRRKSLKHWLMGKMCHIVQKFHKIIF